MTPIKPSVGLSQGLDGCPGEYAVPEGTPLHRIRYWSASIHFVHTYYANCTSLLRLAPQLLYHHPIHEKDCIQETQNHPALESPATSTIFS